MPRKNRAAEARAQLASKKLREDHAREEARLAELREKYGVEEDPEPKRGRAARGARAGQGAGAAGQEAGAREARAAAMRRAMASPAPAAPREAQGPETPAPAAPRLEEIPLGAFRKIDPLYQALVSGGAAAGPDGDSDADPDELRSFIEEADPTTHNTYGYLLRIPYAPGSEPCTGPNDPDYPKVSAADFLRGPPPARLPRIPIVIFRSGREFSEFNSRFRLLRDPQQEKKLVESLDKVAAAGGDMRLLPDNRIVVYSPELERKALEATKARTARVDTSHLSTSKMCLAFLVVLLAVGLVVGGLMLVMSRFFPQYFGFGSGSGLSPDQKRAKALQVMGLSEGATEDEVKRQYRKLAVQYHPDRNPNCVDCETKFIEIADAYKVVTSIMEGGVGSTEAKGNAVDYDRLYTVRPMRMR